MKLKVLKLGDKGTLVQNAQEHMNDQFKVELKVDGNFGPVTKAAVEFIQEECHLPIDGIIGPDTWAVILPQQNEPAPDPQTPITSAPRKPREKNIKVEAPKGAIFGLDISHHQGSADMVKISKDFDFIFLKATEGIQSRDPMFQEFRKAAHAAEIPVGAYHFLRPKYSAEAQAESFIRTVGPFVATDLPPVLDFEDHGGLGPEAQLKAVLTWLEMVEEACGRPPILYASPAFINEIGNPPELFRYPLWIANYEVSSPSVPPPWRKWTFWQYAKEGKVDGITSKGVDHNMFYGTKEDLQKFIQIG